MSKKLHDCKIRTGYRVIGPNTSDGSLHSWYFPTLEAANDFAESLAHTTGEEVDVCKYLGSWRVVRPMEFIKAEDETTNS